MIIALLMSQSLLADGLSLASKTPECKWDASLEMSRLITADRKTNQHFDYEPWEQNLLRLANSYLKAGCVDQAEVTFSSVKGLTSSVHIRDKAEAGLESTRDPVPAAPIRLGRGSASFVQTK